METAHQPPPTPAAAGAYLFAVLLIPIYVNMFGIWMRITKHFGPTVAEMLPVISLIVFIVLSLFFFRNKWPAHRQSRLEIVSGIAICLGALFLTDPAFPAKRIHVAEYMFLALVVRYAMSHQLQKGGLLVFPLMFTAILGVHDEFLQGIHSARTYGLRDMSINLLGSSGGALLWSGFNLFSKNNRDHVPTSGTRIALCYLLALVTGVIFLVWPISWYTGDTQLPIWPSIILTATTVFFSYYEEDFPEQWKHGIRAVSIAAFSLLIYPVLSHATKLSFY